MITIKNIFEDIPAATTDEFVDVLAQNRNSKIERIVSMGHVSPSVGWYDQEGDEWVLVLKGAAIISFENQEQVNLEVGDYLNISAHTKHKVKWTDQEKETVWLAVHSV